MQSLDMSGYAPSCAQVLLVEDDPKMVEVLADSLRQDQIILTGARNGSEALAELEDKRFDLVLLDLGLPGMNGFELLRQIKENPKLHLTPVIVLTAWQGTNDKLRGFELGAVDYITKPFELPEFLARVRSVIRMKRLQDQLTQANRDLENARVAAEEANHAKSDFLANMSHEIRTPMNGVIALTNLLLQTELNSEQQDLVETIRTSGESLLTIINDILNFSKIQSGKLELEQRPLDVRQCLEEALDMLAVRAAEKKLDLIYQVAEDLPAQVIGDVTRIRQILVNLIGNAIKFTARGEVYVEVKARPLLPATVRPPGATFNRHTPQWELSFFVHDTGMGIPPERLTRLFQSFSQVDSSITRQYGGTGLGLAISKGLTELMGGKMWVESVEGKGSTFTFLIPVTAAENAPAANLKPHPRLSNRRALVVEDNATARAVVAQHLKRLGLTVRETAHPAQALEWLKTGERFDVGLVDLSLEGLDGASLAAAIHQLPIRPKLPVLLMTGVGMRCPAPRAADSHPLIQLLKPIKPAQLRSALLEAFGGSRTQHQHKPSQAAPAHTDLAVRYPLQVLLVDDNVINQKVAARLLKQFGYTTDIAKSGIEAITALERKSYDLVFMDVQMPEMDGLEATRRIRELQRSAGAPAHFRNTITIIAMTANVMPGDRERCLAAGMDDFVPKPVRSEALQSLIEKYGAQRASAPDKPEAGKPVQDWPPAGEESQPVSAPAELPPVDVERLNEFSGGSAESLEELVTLYLNQSTEQLRLLQQGLDQRDASQIARVAHSFAGASSTCGMTAVVPLLRRLERAAGQNDLPACSALLAGTRQEYQRVQAFIRRHFQLSLTTTSQASVL